MQQENSKLQVIESNGNQLQKKTGLSNESINQLRFPDGKQRSYVRCTTFNFVEDDTHESVFLAFNASAKKYSDFVFFIMRGSDLVAAEFLSETYSVAQLEGINFC